MKPQRLWVVLFFVVLTIAFLGVVAEYPYFRYAGPLIPLIFIPAAMLMYVSARLFLALPVAVFAVWLYTGDMHNYIEKLGHDYKGPMEGIAGALNELAAPGDTVAIAYGDLPVKFYTRNLYVMGAHDRESFESAATVQWIVLRHLDVTERAAKMQRYINRNLDRNNYQIAEIDFPDLPYQNRETPDMHLYTTQKDMPKVRLLRRMDAGR
jgi:hypothetical protein